MNNKLTTTEEILQKARQHVSLSDAEKARGRDAFMNIMSQNSTVSVWKNIFSFNLVTYVFAPLLIVLIITGGVTTASANALPGDMLYPLKTAVYEPMRGIVYAGQDDVSYQEMLAERRLVELTELSAEGVVSETIQESVLAKFDTHRQKAENQAHDISTHALVAVQSEIESNLRAYGRVFASLDQESVQDKIQERITNIVTSRTQTEATIFAVADNLERVSEEKREEVRQVIEEARQEIDQAEDDRVLVQTRLQLNLAEQALEEGIMNEEAGAFAEAVVTYEKAKRFAHEAEKVFSLTNTLAIAPTEIDRQRAETLEEKTRAPVFEATSLAVSVSTSTEETDDVTMATSEAQNIYEYFQETLQDRTNRQSTADAYLDTFAGLEPRDFNGVVTNGGIYQMADGELTFVPTSDNGRSILEYEGHIRLLINIASRLRIELSSHESVDRVVGEINKLQPSELPDAEVGQDSQEGGAPEEDPDTIELPIEVN